MNERYKATIASLEYIKLYAEHIRDKLPEDSTDKTMLSQIIRLADEVGDYVEGQYKNKSMR